MSSVIALPKYGKLPELLQQYPAWVLWKYQEQGRTKPGKVPVNPVTFRNCDAFEKMYQLSLRTALDLAAPRGLGVGVVLTGDPIQTSNGNQHLIGLDFDNCEDKSSELEALWKRLGKPYVEVSPSGHGLRMFSLCRKLLPGGNSGGGRELYSAKRFLTVTGNPGRGTITDQTDPLVALHDEWFPRKTVPPINLVDRSFPENETNKKRLLTALKKISADCPYHMYRDICWAIFSTGWYCAYDIARDWSMTAPQRFEERTLDTLYRNFDAKRARRHTVGTIFHYSRNS